MKPLPPDADILAVARNVIWFEPPEQAIANPIRFMAYLLTYGTAEEIAAVRNHLGPEDLREAVEKAPPGIFDERSWAYWNLMIDRVPAPPLPRRTIPD
jgi:hypothetical protein